MARVDIFLPEKLQAQMQSRRRTSDSWQYSCNLVPKNAFEKMGELFGRFALLATCSYDCAYWVTVVDVVPKWSQIRLIHSHTN